MQRRSDYYIHYTTNSKKYGKVVPCAVCQGTGRDHTNSLIGVRCENCGGTGKVRV